MFWSKTKKKLTPIFSHSCISSQLFLRKTNNNINMCYDIAWVLGHIHNILCYFDDTLGHDEGFTNSVATKTRLIDQLVSFIQSVYRNP